MDLTGHTVIYGGSFNPPHISHQLTCLYLLEGLNAAAVWLMPAWSHALGKPLIDFATRVTMCELLALPLGPRVEVSRVEEQLGGVSRTYDTLRHLQAQQPSRRFALAVGADILDQTPRWYRWPDIAAMLPIVVIGRADAPHNPPDTCIMPAIASHQVRKRLADGLPVDGLVPARVVQFIAQHGLYGCVPAC